MPQQDNSPITTNIPKIKSPRSSGGICTTRPPTKSSCSGQVKGEESMVGPHWMKHQNFPLAFSSLQKNLA